MPAVTARLTQYDEHAVSCRCGRVHVASPPPGAGEAGTVAYGPNVQAWVIFLLVIHHVPVERCADILSALAGHRPSDGFVHSLLARAEKAVRAANMLIRALMITASVLCADETPLRAGPGPRTRKKYLLVACTNLVTYYYLGGRDLGTFGEFVFPDLSGTVLVHDRYANYDSTPGVLHQLCTAHILRDLEDCAQAYPDAVWPGQAAETLRGLIHAANVARDKGLASAPQQTPPPACTFSATPSSSACGRSPGPRRERQAENRPVPARMPQGPGGRRLAVSHQPADTPTSNQAERDLRPTKTQQKISGRLRSETATGTGTQSGATSTPPASTAGTS